MGSHTFDNTYYGDVTADQAYRALVEEALYTEGHDPYNGTISTTGGFRVVQTTPVTYAEAARISEKRINNLRKWEACEAIPLVAETPAEYGESETGTVELNVSGDVYNDSKKLDAYLRKALGLKTFDTIDGWSNVRPGSADRTTKVEVGVKAEAPKEKAVTRYFVLMPHAGMPAWENGFATQAEARASLKSGVLRYGFNGVPDVDVEIIGITRRESGAPLVKGTVFAKKVTGTLTVQYRRRVKAGRAGTARAGWYFYGWAAS